MPRPILELLDLYGLCCYDYVSTTSSAPAMRGRHSVCNSQSWILPAVTGRLPNSPAGPRAADNSVYKILLGLGLLMGGTEVKGLKTTSSINQEVRRISWVFTLFSGSFGFQLKEKNTRWLSWGSSTSTMVARSNLCVALPSTAYCASYAFPPVLEPVEVYKSYRISGNLWFPGGSCEKTNYDVLHPCFPRIPKIKWLSAANHRRAWQTFESQRTPFHQAQNRMTKIWCAHKQHDVYKHYVLILLYHCYLPQHYHSTCH